MPESRDRLATSAPSDPLTPGSPLPRELGAFAATLAERYALQRAIGRGGMATVYLARDLKHERPVALKVLDPQLGAVLGTERFLAEIRVTANLQHPNLLPLFDSGQAAGLLFYVMPYVEGESLRSCRTRAGAPATAPAPHHLRPPPDGAVELAARARLE